MRVINKISEKSRNLWDAEIPGIAFLGDSVTQGCFEVYMSAEDELSTVIASEYGYHNYVAKILRMLYPNSPLTIINAGISGDDTAHGYRRLKKDVLRYHPDLVVVSYGLNDSMKGKDGLEDYAKVLGDIFREIKDSGSECIFLTENMMNTYVSYRIKDELTRSIARNTMECENSGVLELYFETAKKVAAEYGVIVCDVYSKWKSLARNGVDTTSLLANDINHPRREMNWLFAYSLIETMMNN